MLEQAARLLYKEWFVHLRFPGHEHTKIKDGVPEGWERKTIGEMRPSNMAKPSKRITEFMGHFLSMAPVELLEHMRKQS